MALGVYRVFADAGRPAPGDIRVAGFDDDPMSAYLTPSLTTVRPDGAALGASTLDLLSGNGIPGSPPPAVLDERQSGGDSQVRRAMAGGCCPYPVGGTAVTAKLG